jgi:flagellar hook-associated protein 3 FlgL
MIPTSIGDGAQFLTQSRQNTRLKTELNTLAAQLSSGEIKDKAKALGGDTARFSAIDYGLKTIFSKIARNRETAITLSTMQRTLDVVNDQRVALSETLTKITRDSPQNQIDAAGRGAVSRFETLVNSLNTEVGGRRLFAGNAVDQPALAPPADILANLVTAVGPTTDFEAIETIVDTWFDDPAGGFMTTAYLGDTGDATTRRLDDATVITIEARADNVEVRETLKAAALAALADQVPGLSKTTTANLLFEGGIRLQSAATSLVDVQARLGFLENEIERVTTTQTAEQTALNIARNEIANDDPFETASALQAIQIQLETHYQMTARLSQLSLAQFLR